MDNLYPFTAHSIDLDGNRLSFLDEGKGRTVVMLHGNPTWSFYYRNLVLQLRDRYRVIVPDHLGCGLSSKPQDYPYLLSNHIQNLQRLLDTLDIREYSLVMHDWGGAIGMGLACRAPERVRSLVVMNTAAFRSCRIPWRIQICRVPWLGALLVRGGNLFARLALSMAVTSPLPAEVAQGYLAPYNSWHNRIAILRFVEDIPLSTRDSSWETLTEIEAGLSCFLNTPMLILWGGKDFCFNKSFYDKWKEKFPFARSIYFADAGHYVLEDAFLEIAQEITIFLNNLDGRN